MQFGSLSSNGRNDNHDNTQLTVECKQASPFSLFSTVAEEEEETNQTLCYFFMQSSSSSRIRNMTMKWEGAELPGSSTSFPSSNAPNHQETVSCISSTSHKTSMKKDQTRTMSRKKQQRVRIDESRNETFVVVGHFYDTAGSSCMAEYKTLAWYSRTELKRIRADVIQDIQSLSSSTTTASAEIYKLELLELMDSIRMDRPVYLDRYVSLLMEDDRRSGLIFRQVPTLWRLRRHYVYLSRKAVIKSTTPANLSMELSRTNRLVAHALAQALHLSIISIKQTTLM